MRCRFFMFVVFTTVVQNSFGMQTTTSARLQSETMTDYYKINTLKKIANLEVQKVVDIIFTDLTYLVNEACADRNSSGDSSFSKNTSKTEVLGALGIQLAVTLSAIQITNLEIYSKIPTALQDGFLQHQNYVGNIFKGIELVRRKNSPGNVTQIEDLENKTVSTAPSFNAVIYDMMRYPRNNLLKIKTSIQRAQIKSNVQLGIVSTNIYAGIKAVMVAITARTQAQCKNVLLTVDSARNQAYLAFKAVNDINFSLVHNTLLGSYVMQPEIDTHYAVIQAIEIVEISDNENTINSTLTSTQPGSCEVTPENENEIITESAVIQRSEEVALCKAYKSTSLIYTTINAVLKDVADGNHCLSEDEPSIIDIAEMKEYLAYKSIIDIYFNLTILAQPNAISAVNGVRNATYCSLMKLVESFNLGIKLAKKKNSKGILAEIEYLQNATISAAIDAVTNIFIPITNARNSQTSTGIAIGRARSEVYFHVTTLLTTIFAAIKFLLAQVFPEYRLAGDDCFSSIEAAENESLSAALTIVETILGAIRLYYWDGRRFSSVCSCLDPNLYNSSKCSSC